MKLILCHIDRALEAAWSHVFADLPGVEITGGDIYRVPCDAIASPANSFGFT